MQHLIPSNSLGSPTLKKLHSKLPTLQLLPQPWTTEGQKRGVPFFMEKNALDLGFPWKIDRYFRFFRGPFRGSCWRFLDKFVVWQIFLSKEWSFEKKKKHQHMILIHHSAAPFHLSSQRISDLACPKTSTRSGEKKNTDGFSPECFN